MMKTIYFVRHGHYRIPPQNPNDLSLSYKHVLTLMGIEDVIDVAKTIRDSEEEVHSIYTSPFKRTKETANLLSRVLKKPVLEKERLSERFKKENTVEHFQDIFSEFDSEINDILNNTSKTNVVVSHKLPISLFLSIKSGVSYQEVTEDYAHIDLIKMGGCFKAVFEGTKLLSYDKV